MRADQISALVALRRHPGAPREQLEAFRDARLRRLVAHAYANVPYYRALMIRAGVRPKDVRGAADLSTIPVTTKQIMRELPASEITARGVNRDRLISRPTSGSSGQPFTVRRTWWEARLLNAFRARAMASYGLRRGHRRTFLIGEQRPNDPKRLLRNLGLVQDQLLNCLRPAEEVLREMRAFRPDVVVGYPGVLARITSVMAQETAAPLRLRLVITGAEVLAPHVRRRIAGAFAAPVFDIYGSHEFNLLAWECPRGGPYHTCDDGTVIEVVRDGRPARQGEQGEVVATNLHAFAVPFIRYRLGDLVTMGARTCTCGQPFSTIGAIEGRVWDLFPLRDGRVLHPQEFVAPLRDKSPWVRDYQILQEREDSITVRVVPWAPPHPSDVEGVAAQLRAILRGASALRFEVVHEIPLEASGKFRAWRSMVWRKEDEVQCRSVRS
jgi:phenylacetate-CoA ligase